MVKRLTEKHPLMIKLRALEAHMDDAEISIEWYGHRMIVTDTGSGESATYQDAESGEHISELPHIMETKLICEE